MNEDQKQQEKDVRAPDRDAGWRSDEFATGEVGVHFGWFVIFLLAIAAVSAPFFFGARSAAAKSVTVYCAQDRVYAEPIFRDFERETGLRVRAIYDSEAVKTVGLANRLLAERNHPRCDLFWGNEEMRTRLLAAKGVFHQTNGWAGFGCRTRRIVINTNLVTAASVPKSLLELTNIAWRGKIALAYPQFGTTATHFHALRQAWGTDAWLAWCSALAANKPLLLDGNSLVVKMVGRGEAALGLTDSDDVAAGQSEGLPVVALPLTPEALLIPNTVGLVRGGPSSIFAEKLFDYLRRPEVVQRLVAANALEFASASAGMSGLNVDWEKLLEDLDATTAELNRIFLK